MDQNLLDYPSEILLSKWFMEQILNHSSLYQYIKSNHSCHRFTVIQNL